MIFLPEAFAFLGDDKLKSKDIADADITGRGPVLWRYAALAKKHNVWISLGGMPVLAEAETDKVYNCHLIIDIRGIIVTHYNKMHLFDVDIPNKISIRESAWTKPGDSLVTCASPVGCLGLSVCYDLRFPGLFSALRRQGAEVLVVPSAFSSETGPAHWHALLRARAIENQCYVVAAAQVGVHNAKRRTFGHSLVIDPWGTVIASTSPKASPSFVVAEIDLDMVRRVRQAMPIGKQERPHLYAKL